MATQPVYYLEQKRKRSIGAHSSGTLAEAGRQQPQRRWVFDNNRDAHENIPQASRLTMATLGRQVYQNFGIPKGTLDEIADTVCANIKPQFNGEDRDWGDMAEQYLRDTDPVSNVRGLPYTTQETERLIVLAILRVGEMFILNTENAEHFPRHQILPSHRIFNPSQIDQVQGGPWDGLQIIDGVLVDKLLRPVAYRYAPSNVQWTKGDRISMKVEANDDGNTLSVTWRNAGNEILFQDLSARTVHHCYLPEWEDQVRGYSSLAASLWDWTDIKESREFDQQGRKLAAARSFIEYNESGESEEDIFTDVDEGASRFDDNNRETRFRQAKVDGFAVQYMQARTGSRIDVVEDKRPTQEQQQFEQEIIRSALHALGWSYDYAYNPEKVKGAVARVVVERINRKAKSIRERGVIPWRRRFDTYRIAKAMKRGELPFNRDWYRFGYGGFQNLTADKKYDVDVDLRMLRAGIVSKASVAQKYGADLADLDLTRETELDRLLTAAERIAAAHPDISVETAFRLLQELDQQQKDFSDENDNE